MMKIVRTLFPTVFLAACGTIDIGAEAAKLDVAAQQYRRCLVDMSLSGSGNVDLYCRSARIGLLQAVLADPRTYEKTPAFDALAKNAVEMAKSDIGLAKSAPASVGH